MKKIISLILALVLCLSLCACGSSNTESTAPITNGNPAASEESTAVTPEETVETTVSEAEDHPLLPQLCGEWVLRIQDDDAAFASIVIYRDGNCIVDGVEATWKYPDHPTVNFYIEVYNGAEMICAVMLYESAEGMTINGVDTDGWVCPGIYEKIS